MANLLFVLLTIVAPAFTQTACIPRGLFGMYSRYHVTNIHFTNPLPGVLNQVRTSYSIARMDLTWSKIEKQIGKYDFTEYDILIHSLCNNTQTPPYQPITPYLIFDYANPLYQSDKAPSTSEAITAFVNFVIACVTRYQKQGIIFELWNEPNLEYSWKPYPNATAYAVLATNVGYAFKSQFPQELLIGPATFKLDIPYIQEIFEYNNSEILQYFDAISVHPYRIGEPESVIDRYIELKNLIAEYQNSSQNQKQIPIISGEWGWSTCFDNKTQTFIPCIGSAPTGIASYLDQAKYLIRQWVINDYMKVPVSIFYDYKNDGNDPLFGEDNFGTVEYEYQNETIPYIPKLAFHAAKWYQQYINDIWGYESIERVVNVTCNNCKQNDVYIIAYVTKGEAAGIVFIAWYARQDVTNGINATFTLGSGQKYDNNQKCYDMFGNTLGNCISVLDETLFMVQNLTDCPIYFVMWFN
eukprot:105695_1